MSEPNCKRMKRQKVDETRLCGLPRVVWIHCIGPFLGVLAMARLRGCNRRLRKWFPANETFPNLLPDRGLHEAAKIGDLDLCSFFQRQGAENTRLAMDGAALGGHIELLERFYKFYEPCYWPVKHIFENGSKAHIEWLKPFAYQHKWQGALFGAAKAGNVELLDEAEKLGDTDYTSAAWAVGYNYSTKVLEWFKDKDRVYRRGRYVEITAEYGALMLGLIEGGNFLTYFNGKSKLHFVPKQYRIQIRCLLYAREILPDAYPTEHLHLVYLIKRGELEALKRIPAKISKRDWMDCVDAAKSSGYKDVVAFVQSQIGQ